MDPSELRHARERMGLSLRDVADRTKIRAAILDAIENNDADRLPPPIFARGFIRAYAREVGLDPQMVARRYFPEPAAAPARSAASTPNRSVGESAIWLECVGRSQTWAVREGQNPIEQP